MNINIVKIDHAEEYIGQYIALAEQCKQDHESASQILAGCLSQHKQLLNECSLTPFIAYLDHQPVACAVAIVDPAMRDPNDNVIGQIGFFQALNNQEVANDLFSTIKQFFVSQHIEQIVGPLNGSPLFDFRLMAAGFDSTPFPLEVRTPDYYLELFEQFGFKRLHDWHTFQGRNHDILDILNSKFFKFQKLLNKHQYQVEIADLDNIDAALEILYEVFDSWQGTYGYYNKPSKNDFFAIIPPLLSLCQNGDLLFLKNNQQQYCGFSFSYLSTTDKIPTYVIHSLAISANERNTSGIIELIKKISVISQEVHQAQQFILAMVTQDFKWFSHYLKPTRSYTLLGYHA